MGLSKETLLEFLSLIEDAEEFRPLVKLTVEKVLSFGPEVKPLFEATGNYLIERRIDSIRKFEAAGFSREEAILLTLDQSVARNKLINMMSNSEKSKTT